MTYIIDGIEIVLLLVLMVLAVPVVALAMEIWAAVLFGKRIKWAPTQNIDRPRIAVLIPAHNEGEGLLPTLEDVFGQLVAGDRCLVVADNCDDETADVARRAGAEVIERHDPARRGKGYALDFGVRYLKADPPSIVIIVDADCRVSDGTIPGLAYQTRQTGRPCQARYIMNLPSEPSVRHRFAAFAWIVKTYVRPLGLKVMGAPCGLMGTGMAFPWELIGKRALATDHITEDAQLGVELAVEGYGTLFCSQLEVSSVFPATEASIESQSRRWEHGSLMVLTKQAPKALKRAVMSGAWGAVAVCLDAFIPPLTSLVVTLLTCLMVTTVLSFLGFVGFFIISLMLVLVLSAGLSLTWYIHGRQLLRAQDLISLPSFIGGKLKSYFAFGRGRRSKWTRTKRL